MSAPTTPPSPSSYKCVIVIRHGERSDCNKPASEINPDLTEKGKAEIPVMAQRLMKFLSEKLKVGGTTLGENSDSPSNSILLSVASDIQIFSSPFHRCFETAAHLHRTGIGANRPLLIDNQLCEVFGPVRIKAAKETPILPCYVTDPKSQQFNAMPLWPESIENAHRRFSHAFRSYGLCGYNNKNNQKKQHHHQEEPSSNHNSAGAAVTATTTFSVPSQAREVPIIILVTHGDGVESSFAAMFPQRLLYDCNFLGFHISLHETPRSYYSSDENEIVAAAAAAKKGDDGDDGVKTAAADGGSSSSNSSSSSWSYCMIHQEGLQYIPGETGEPSSPEEEEQRCDAFIQGFLKSCACGGDNIRLGPSVEKDKKLEIDKTIIANRKETEDNKKATAASPPIVVQNVIDVQQQQHMSLRPGGGIVDRNGSSPTSPCSVGSTSEMLHKRKNSNGSNSVGGGPSNNNTHSCTVDIVSTGGGHKTNGGDDGPEFEYDDGPWSSSGGAATTNPQQPPQLHGVVAPLLRVFTVASQLPLYEYWASWQQCTWFVGLISLVEGGSAYFFRSPARLPESIPLVARKKSCQIMSTVGISAILKYLVTLITYWIGVLFMRLVAGGDKQASTNNATGLSGWLHATFGQGVGIACFVGYFVLDSLRVAAGNKWKLTNSSTPRQ